MELRRPVLRLLVGAVLVAGAAGLFGLLRGQFTDVDARVIATSLLFGVATTLAAAGIAEGRALGRVTVAATGLAFALVVYGMWMDVDAEGFWRATGCVGIVALDGAHACFVLARRRTDDAAAVRGWSTVAVIATGLSAALGVLGASGVVEGSGGAEASYLKVLGAVLVVQIVATLVGSLQRRLGGARPERPLLAPEDEADRLRREVLAAAARLERVSDDPLVRAECARLRAVAAH